MRGAWLAVGSLALALLGEGGRGTALAQASDPGTRDAARRVIELTVIQTGTLDRLRNGITGLVAQVLKLSLEKRLGRSLSADEQGRLVQVAGRVMRDAASDQAMAEIYVDLYAEHFTEAELREILRFYQTGTGEKALRLSGQLAREGGERAQRMVTAREPEIRARFEAEFQRAFPELTLPPR